MASLPKFVGSSTGWPAEALALVASAQVLSGVKLEQLVVRLQRLTGHSKQACWRFVIQRGIRATIADHRRWTEEEIDFVREELVKRSIEEVADKLHRTPKAIRNMLQRQQLSLRDIRCDRFSLESLSTALRVRKSEIQFWIKQGWLVAAVDTHGKRHSYNITPESLSNLYRRHLPDLLKRGIPNQSLFEAYLQYCYSPKHTLGEQLLDVRRDKRERAAYAATLEGNDSEEGEDEPNEYEQDRHIGLEADRRSVENPDFYPE
jgi:hypothetical protein